LSGGVAAASTITPRPALASCIGGLFLLSWRASPPIDRLRRKDIEAGRTAQRFGDSERARIARLDLTGQRRFARRAPFPSHEHLLALKEIEPFRSGGGRKHVFEMKPGVSISAEI